MCCSPGCVAAPPSPRATPPPRWLEALPRIPIRIENEADVSLSVTISSNLCAPRVLLQPRQSAVVPDCFRWGLVYHVLAVFYDRHAVQERHHVLRLARPGQSWVFSRRAPPATQDAATTDGRTHSRQPHPGGPGAAR